MFSEQYNNDGKHESPNSNFENLLSNLDLNLFKYIGSQTSENDKRSLLACQYAVRNLSSEYSYLEIGSHLGGSIQPFLLDPQCRNIYSIDRRPEMQPDERGIDCVYKDNSTQRMLNNLKEVSETGLAKITCFDSDSSEVPPESITERPQVCFIDGEHTDEAAQRDFQFCLKVLADNGAIIFHDAAVIYNALNRIIETLKEKQITFTAYHLPDVMFVIEIGDFPIHKSPHIHKMLINNYEGYLASLMFNDSYRQFANKSILRWYRRFRVRLEGNSVIR
jgi:hypothetical protein